VVSCDDVHKVTVSKPSIKVSVNGEDEKQSSPLAHHSDAVRKGDMMDGVLAFSSPLQNVNSLREYPPDCLVFLETFLTLWPLDAPVKPRGKNGGEFAQWVKETRQVKLALAEFGINGLGKVHAEWNKNQFCVSHPGAILNLTRSTVMSLRSKKAHPDPAPLSPGEEAARRAAFLSAPSIGGNK
jgi:hypothetical protein